MGLNTNQVNEILKSPKNKGTISKAILLEQRLKFHTETNLSVSDISRPTYDFLDWVRGLLPKDKYNTFLQLFSFPLPTAAIVEDIYRELERVFYSRNSSSSYRFTDSSLAEDWNTYRTRVLDEPNVWKTLGWQSMKTAISSVLVVDLPEEQTTDKPEPYFYFANIRSVVDYETIGGTKLNWLIIKQADDSILVIDDEAYTKYKLGNNKVISRLSVATHDLKYCPAQFFWSDYITEDAKSIKKNNITKQLSNLDWYLFFSTSKKHLDLYGPYPIYSAYEADCSFANNDTGSYCDGGFLRNTEGNYIISKSGLLDRCPVCEEKRIVGPGSFLEVPIPSDGQVDLKNPVQITTVDKDSLAYNTKECERLRNDIIISCVGSNGLVSEKEAINVKQVASNFENKTSVLINLKANFEIAQRFVEDTICKLRFGSDFVSSSVSWGSEFYVYTVDELYAKYKLAKDNGASMSELDSLVNQIIETEYRDNPTMLQRMYILKQVEPFRHLTIAEVTTLCEKQFISDEELVLKLNLNSYIDKFERENINIVEYGSNTSMDTKINTLTNKLYEYVKTDLTRKVIKPVTVVQTA